MNKRVMVLGILLIAVLLVAHAPAEAQQEGFHETFDDPTLAGWERSREVVVADGVLRMNPGSFALRAGDWSEIDMSIRIRYTGPGEIWVNYYFRDEAKYGVLLTDRLILLEKAQHGSPSEMGHAGDALVQSGSWMDLRVVVAGGQHQVYLNRELQITATDPEPLSTGAILLQVMGEATAEFDDLELTGVPGQGPPPPEEEPAVRPQEGAVEEPHPEGEPGIPAPEPGAPEPVPAAGDEGVSAGSKDLIDEFFASQASNVELTTFLINLVLAAVTSFVLGRVYIHWGSSLSNRRKFASNFMLMTVTTAFIILVVRSSVALSLGLVGALSIVRFRTAVKEPEELAYLFFAIGLGIGLGDNQRLITLLALAAGIVIIGLARLFRRSQSDLNLHLTIASRNPNKVELEQLMEVLRAHCAKLKLLRFDENAEVLEASFVVEFRRVSNLSKTKAAIRALSDSAEITFLDNRGIW
jgi:hypothetical protein